MTGDNMLLDIFHLFSPALGVHAKRFGPARRRDVIESGFDDGK